MPGRAISSFYRIENYKRQPSSPQTDKLCGPGMNFGSGFDGLTVNSKYVAIRLLTTDLREIRGSYKKTADAFYD